MELLLTDEQRLLADSVVKALAKAGGVKRTRELRGKAGGFDRQAHVQWAMQGWLGILVPEELGGAGLGLTELGLVAMEAGRALAPEPIAASAVVARSIALGLGSRHDEALLAGVLEGRVVVVPATAGAADVPGVAWQLPSKEAGVRLDGRVTGVAMAGDCDGVLVDAKGPSDGVGAGAQDGVLAYVARETPGVSIASRATVDGRPSGDIAFSNVVPGATFATAGAPGALCDLLLFAQAAELVGVMSAAIDITVEYLKTREQFGKPIGSFQALQHRIVDDYARMVSARSFVFQVAAQGPGIAASMASALKAHAATSALEVTKSAIQMHGGIGFTEDCDIGLYLKRAMWLSACLGNAAQHRARYASLME
jgi:alkylation response protein AidB-like acyl-CoA dehydrogenase